MKKILKVLLIIIVLLTFISFIDFYNKLGNIDMNDGVYTNKYFNITLVEPPNFYIDEEFSCKYINHSDMNLFKMVSDLSSEKSIISATAHKLNSNLNEYIESDLEDNRKNMINRTSIIKEGIYMTYEYENKNWNNKVFICEKKGYAIKIVISYKDKKDKDYYLHNINLINNN